MKQSMRRLFVLVPIVGLSVACSSAAPAAPPPPTSKPAAAAAAGGPVVTAGVVRRLPRPFRQGDLDGLCGAYAVVNAVGWFALFVAGAAWRMSKDTSRV